MQACPGERSAPHSLVLTVRTSHDKSLSFKGPQHAAEITGVNSQAATKLANFGTVVSNLPKQSSLVHWATLSFITIVPGVSGAEFVVGSAPKRTLIIRDAQHEYIFEERKLRHIERRMGLFFR